MYQLKNDLLAVNIKHKGAELCNIKSVKSNLEFLWQADPKFWASHAPNLFPVIGALKNDSFYYDSKLYKMPKHGFVRNNEDFKIVAQSETNVTLKLETNEKIRSIYPFHFQFLINYELFENILHVNHTVKNLDSKNLYFSLGGHPAFNCPLYKNELYSDYFLHFEKQENSESHILNMATGLVTDMTKTAFTSPNQIQLRSDLFDEDALIFKTLKSRKVSLKHNKKGELLSVTFNDFPYLGIWAKPNAPYVCIEPWLGIADSEDTDQQIAHKEGIISLSPNTDFKAIYSIEINNNHLA